MLNVGRSFIKISSHWVCAISRLGIDWRGGGEGSHMKGVGMLVGNFELKS